MRPLIYDHLSDERTITVPTLYPHADYRPLGPQTQARMRAYDLITLHTMAGALWPTDAYFRTGGYGGTESHFGLAGDGDLLQWQDLDYRADAQLEGNERAISIETADRGAPFGDWDTRRDEVPPWTGAQLDALAPLIAWLCDRYDIPCTLVPDSRPERRGIAYHRQGIDPWRVAGGERWSTARGKVCPGQARIAQIPALIDDAAALLAPSAPPIAPAPARPGMPAGTPRPIGLRLLRLTDPPMRGDDVRVLQAHLNRVYPAYSRLVVDGVFGPATASVVREFQRRSRLVVDAKVGPATRRALGL